MKFDSKLREAVFLGYKFAPGCIWKKEYVVLDWKKAKRAEGLRSTAVYRVREVQPLEHEEYPFITRVKELQCPRIFVHKDDAPNGEPETGVAPQDVGGDFDIAPDAGGVVAPPLDEENDNDDEEADRVTPQQLPTESSHDAKHEAAQQQHEKDIWILKKFEITRVHKEPRDKMFSPLTCRDPPPIPWHRFDVERTTKTDSEEAESRKIEDVWDGSINDTRSLGFTWTGETTFMLHPEEEGPPGHIYVLGRWIKEQSTQRPPNIWPEMWSILSKKKNEGEGRVEQKEGFN